MVRGLGPLACLVGLLVGTAGAVAQGEDPAGLVDRLYRKYTGVGPTPDQLQFWLEQMRRGVSAADVHANLIGSDAFYNRHQRNDAAFITGTYAEVLGVAPDPKSLDFWLDQLRRHRNDRVKWAKAFLKTAGVQLPPAAADPPAAVAGPDLPGRLLTTCQLLFQAAQAECGGQPGWLIQNQAREFINYIQASLPTARNPGAEPNAYRTFLAQMDSGVNGIRTTLAAASLPAPATRQHLEQVAQLLAAMAALLPDPAQQPWPPVPPGPPPAAGRVSRDEFVLYRRLLQETAREARQSSAVVRTALPPGWAARRLAADIDDLVAALDRVRTGLRVGQPEAEVRGPLVGIQVQMNRLTQRLKAEVADVRAAQSWGETVQAFARLAAAVRLDGQPPPPGPGFPPPPPGGATTQALVAIDRGVGECDALVTAFGPYLYYNPAVPRLQEELRALRGQLAGLRQAAATTADKRELLARYSPIAVGVNTRVGRFWDEAVREAQIPNAPPLTGLTDAVRDAGRLLQLD